MRQGSEQRNQNRLMSQGNEALKLQDEEPEVSTTAFERLMERAFGKSSRISNIAINCCFAAFLTALVLFALYMTTGGSWVSKWGIACLNVMFISCAIAFSAQKISQAVRILSALAARIKGQNAPVFKEEEPCYSKLIKKAYKIAKEKGTDLFSSIKTTTCHRVSRVIVRARTNARAYHGGAKRPAFAHASIDGGGGGSGDDPGDSDQGDPPGPSYRTAPLKLSQTFHRKSNSPSLPLRLSVSDCCRMHRHELSSHRRCPA